MFGGLHPFLVAVFFWWEITKWCQLREFPTRVWTVEKKTSLLFNINFIGFVCDDRPALQFSKSVKNHNVYYGFGRCLVHSGGGSEERVVFDDINYNLRSNQSFIKQEYHDHQIGKFPLIDSSIKCIFHWTICI